MGGGEKVADKAASISRARDMVLLKVIVGSGLVDCLIVQHIMIIQEHFDDRKKICFTAFVPRLPHLPRICKLEHSLSLTNLPCDRISS